MHMSVSATEERHVTCSPANINENTRSAGQKELQTHHCTMRDVWQASYSAQARRPGAPRILSTLSEWQAHEPNKTRETCTLASWPPLSRCPGPSSAYGEPVLTHSSLVQISKLN